MRIEEEYRKRTTEARRHGEDGHGEDREEGGEMERRRGGEMKTKKLKRKGAKARRSGVGRAVPADSWV